MTGKKFSRDWQMLAATHTIALSIGVIITAILVFFSTKKQEPYGVITPPYSEECRQVLGTRKSGVLKNINGIYIELDVLSKRVKYLLATYDLHCAEKCRESKTKGVNILPVPVMTDPPSKKKDASTKPPTMALLTPQRPRRGLVQGKLRSRVDIAKKRPRPSSMRPQNKVVKGKKEGRKR